MPEEAETGPGGTNTEKEILFKCKFCGNTKPLSDLVVIRRYYPQLTACKDCAIGAEKTSESD